MLILSFSDIYATIRDGKKGGRRQGNAGLAAGNDLKLLCPQAEKPGNKRSSTPHSYLAKFNTLSTNYEFCVSPGWDNSCAAANARPCRTSSPRSQNMVSSAILVAWSAIRSK